MPDELIVRSADKKDLSALLELYGQLNPNDEILSIEDGNKILEQFLDYSGNTIILGFRDDIAVSTCTLVIVPNLTRGGAPYAFIENVITHAQYRKKGYGKTLLNAAISRAWEQNCYKVMLLTGSRDPATLKFYEAVGFEQNKTGFQIRRIPSRSL